MNLHIVPGSDFSSVNGEDIVREFVQPAYNMGKVLRNIHGDYDVHDEEIDSGEGASSEFSKFEVSSPQFQQFEDDALTFLSTSSRPADLQKYFKGETILRPELKVREDAFLPIKGAYKPAYDFARWCVEHKMSASDFQQDVSSETNKNFLSPGSFEDEDGVSPKIVFSMRERGVTVEQEWAQRLHFDPTFWKYEAPRTDNYESRCMKEENYMRENSKKSAAEYDRMLKEQTNRRKFGSQTPFSPFTANPRLYSMSTWCRTYRVENVGNGSSKEMFENLIFDLKEDNSSTPHLRLSFLLNGENGI